MSYGAANFDGVNGIAARRHYQSTDREELEFLFPYGSGLFVAAKTRRKSTRAGGQSSSRQSNLVCRPIEARHSIGAVRRRAVMRPENVYEERDQPPFRFFAWL